jgi:hypothetical protein
MFFYFHIVTAPCLMFNLFGFICTSWNLCCGIWSSPPPMPSQTDARGALQRSRLLTLIKVATSYTFR